MKLVNMMYLLDGPGPISSLPTILTQAGEKCQSFSLPSCRILGQKSSAEQKFGGARPTASSGPGPFPDSAGRPSPAHASSLSYPSGSGSSGREAQIFCPGGISHGPPVKYASRLCSSSGLRRGVSPLCLGSRMAAAHRASSPSTTASLAAVQKTSIAAVSSSGEGKEGARRI